MTGYPKDKNGVEFKSGDLFQEGWIGEKIWENSATILNPPIGLFTGERADPGDILGGWMVETFIKGIILDKEGDLGDLYISRWDGEFMGDWDNTLIIGNITDTNKTFREII